MLQPGSTAAANATGVTEESIVPIYGMKRNRPAKMPHSNGFGKPITSSPAAMTTPKTAFSPSWVSKNRLSRFAASSNACVVRCKSSIPNRRMNRSRRSACWSRMKIVTMKTMPAVASGATAGARIRSAISSDVKPGWRSSTSIGLGSAVSGAAAVGAAFSTGAELACWIRWPSQPMLPVSSPMISVLTPTIFRSIVVA